MLGPKYHIKKTVRRIVLLGMVLGLGLILSTSRSPSVLETILSKGVLRIITFRGPTTYFENAKGPTGFEYLLAKSFADSLGVELQTTVMEGINPAFNAIGGPKGDFAAAGLTVTDARHMQMRFSRPYDSITQKLIYRMGSRRPQSLDDLESGLLLAIANSSHTEQLEELKKEHPNLKWEEYPWVEMLELMEFVQNEEADYAIVDSNAFQINRNYHPKVQAAFDISEPQDIAWAFPNHGDDSLLTAANHFLNNFAATGQLQRLKNRFAGHVDKFNFADSQLFHHRIKVRLPQFLGAFLEAEAKFELDWHLIAAIAYQESHWNPEAVSPTEVKGLMMLTHDTSKEMGITDRLDPRQSIDGGVRYFLKTRKRIPGDILEPDRTWLALAAYNIGMGHLEDARVLTERHGKDPDLWENVREHLPLLEQRRYYTTVRHGYARGQEPVDYVQNIRNYKTILQWGSLTDQRKEDREAKNDDFDLWDWDIELF